MKCLSVLKNIHASNARSIKLLVFLPLEYIQLNNSFCSEAYTLFYYRVREN